MRGPFKRTLRRFSAFVATTLVAGTCVIAAGAAPAIADTSVTPLWSGTVHVTHHFGSQPEYADQTRDLTLTLREAVIENAPEGYESFDGTQRAHVGGTASFYNDAPGDGCLELHGETDVDYEDFYSVTFGEDEYSAVGGWFALTLHADGSNPVTSSVAGLQDVANYFLMPVSGTNTDCTAVSTSELWHPLYPPLGIECNDAMRAGVDSQLASDGTVNLSDVEALDGTAHQDLGDGHCDVEWHLTASIDNHPPVANDDSVTDAPAGASTTVHALVNDTDEDADVLSVGSFGQPGCGTVSLVSATQTLSYTAPADGCVGGTSFTYRASDGRALSAPATVSISVACPDSGGSDITCDDSDVDEDGVLDVNDECPLEPGPASTQGCPPKCEHASAAQAFTAVKSTVNLDVPFGPDVQLFEFDPEVRWCEDHGLTVVDDASTFGTVRSDALGQAIGTAFGSLGFTAQYNEAEELITPHAPAPTTSVTVSGQFDACFDILSLVNAIGFSVGGKAVKATNALGKEVVKELTKRSKKFAAVDEAITAAIVKLVNKGDKLEHVALAAVKKIVNSKAFKVVPKALRTQIRDWAGILASAIAARVLTAAQRYVDTAFRAVYNVGKAMKATYEGLLSNFVDEAINNGIQDSVAFLVPCFPIWQPEVDISLNMTHGPHAETTGFFNPVFTPPNTEIVIDQR